MRKIILAVLSLLIFLIGCKKEATGKLSAIINPTKKLKSKVYEGSIFGSYYFYDPTGRLDSAKIITRYGNSTVSRTEKYSYNVAGRIIKSESSLYTDFY